MASNPIGDTMGAGWAASKTVGGAVISGRVGRWA